MTVERMIKELQKFNPKSSVRMRHKNGEPVLFVLGIDGDSEKVWLESESDANLKNELKERFETAYTEWDEMDFYTDLLETGIDINMVRKYMGDSHANHMEHFCKNHGLI